MTHFQKLNINIILFWTKQNLYNKLSFSCQNWNTVYTVTLWQTFLQYIIGSWINMQFFYPYICYLIMNTVASHSLAKVVVGIKDSIGQMTYLYLLYTLVRANNRFCWIWKLKGVTKNNWGGQCTNKEHPSRPQAQIAHGRV